MQNVTPWVTKTSAILSKPADETGIPTIKEIMLDGCRKQDKVNLEEEFRAEKAKVTRLKSKVVTVEHDVSSPMIEY
jgi:hypothetical protein